MVGVVVTLLVLLIDASLNSRSPGPRQSLAAGAWVDRALPVVTSSNAEGQVLASVWTNGLKMPASQVASTVDQVAAGAARDYTTVVDLQPPATLAGPAGLLEAALLARSKAAAELQKAFDATLGAATVAPGTRTTTGAAPGATTTTGAAPGTTTTTGATDPATVVPRITAAGSELQVGDQAYQLFLSSVPASAGVRFPPSSWATNPAPYSPQAAQTFLATMQSAAVTTPVYQVKIYGLATTPAPVTAHGAVQVLPDVTAITLDVVLADTGNQPESNLTVTATISPAGAGTSSVRDFVDLAVGQAYTITGLGPLNPPQGVPVTLTVTVTPSSGSSLPPVSSSLVFQMPAPAPPTTTTTTTVPKTTSTT